jgi:hypothetical protein
MTDLCATYLSGIRSRGISVADIDDTTVESVISEALYELSRHKPLNAHLTFQTVAQKNEYTWSDLGDASGQTIVMALWSPNGTPSRDFPILLGALGFSYSPPDWDLPSQELIQEIKRTEFMRAFSGTGTQIDPVGGNVWLNPIPQESGTDVFVFYTKGYSDVSKVLPTDRDLFLDLVEAMLSDSIVNIIARKSAAVRVKTPEYEFASGEQIGAWRQNAKDKWARFFSKIGALGSAMGRT